MLNGLRLLQLGDDPDIGLQRIEAAAHVAHIVGGAHEGDGDNVDALADGEDQVFLILLGE